MMQAVPMQANVSYLPPAVGTATMATVAPAPAANVFAQATSAAEAYAAYAASQNFSYSTVTAPKTAPVALEYVSSAPAVEYVSPAPAVEYVSSAPAVEYVSPAPVMTTAPAVSYVQPQVASYIPAPVPAVETIVQAPSYIPAPMGMVQAPMPVVSAAPNVVSYLPPAQMAPVVVEQFPGVDMGGQSVIVEQIGDWLVCEDAMGLFYHHAPTQQSFDVAPPEFLMLFPGGYQPPPLGAFAQSGMAGAPVVYEQFPAPVTYAQPAPAITYAQPAPAVASYLPPMVVEQFAPAPTAYTTAAPVVAGTPGFPQQFAGGIPSQLPPMMAKVLN